MTTAVLDVSGPTEAVAGLSLTTGTSYTIEVDGDWPVRLRETGSAAAPTGTPRGHVLYPGRAERQPDRVTYEPGAGLYLWALPLGPRTALVATEQ